MAKWRHDGNEWVQTPGTEHFQGELGSREVVILSVICQETGDVWQSHDEWISPILSEPGAYHTGSCQEWAWSQNNAAPSPTPSFLQVTQPGNNADMWMNVESLCPHKQLCTGSSGNNNSTNATGTNTFWTLNSCQVSFYMFYLHQPTCVVLVSPLWGAHTPTRSIFWLECWEIWDADPNSHSGWPGWDANSGSLVKALTLNHTLKLCLQALEEVAPSEVLNLGNHFLVHSEQLLTQALWLHTCSKVIELNQKGWDSTHEI